MKDIEHGGDAGVPHGQVLVGLVDATLATDDDQLDSARRRTVAELGPAGLVDAAGVIGTFSMQTRIADATGLPLDTPIELATRTLREEIGANRFGAAAHTPTDGLGKLILSRVAEPLLPRLLNIASRVRRHRP